MKKHILSFSKLGLSLLTAAVLIVPAFAFAQEPSTVIKLVSLVETIISTLFPIVTAVAILVFGYNIGKYMTSKTQADQNVYKSGIVNSLIALFIVFVLFGLIRVLANSLGIPSLGVDITVADPSGLGGGSGGISTFRNIALTISEFISVRVIPILIACATLFFLGNVVVSMSKSDVEAERTKLNAYLKWGVLALFVLLTLFSIVGFFTGSLFGTAAVIPQFPTSE